MEDGLTEESRLRLEGKLANRVNYLCMSRKCGYTFTSRDKTEKVSCPKCGLKTEKVKIEEGEPT